MPNCISTFSIYFMYKVETMRNEEIWDVMTQINLFDYRRHIEVHGRPTPAVFRKKGIQGGKNSHQLVWTVDSYTPIQEYRLLYRQIKPYHPVRIEP